MIRFALYTLTAISLASSADARPLEDLGEGLDIIAYDQRNRDASVTYTDRAGTSRVLAVDNVGTGEYLRFVAGDQATNRDGLALCLDGRRGLYDCVPAETFGVPAPSTGSPGTITPDTELAFECVNILNVQNWCLCEGDDDCNHMFELACPPESEAACVGDACACGW